MNCMFPPHSNEYLVVAPFIAYSPYRKVSFVYLKTDAVPRDYFGFSFDLSPTCTKPFSFYLFTVLN